MEVHEAIAAARARLSYPSQVALSGETVLDVFGRAVRQYADAPAFSCMGHVLTYRELDRLSAAFAAYLQQETALQPGDRIAIQLPNLLQYPVVVFGAMRAGLIVVNTNPLYTPREMEHQFNDAGVKALVVLANMADKVEEVLPQTLLQYVFITEVADLHPLPRRWLLNAAVRHVKKLVPRYHLPGAIALRKALDCGSHLALAPVSVKSTDIAVLQYTGGTTGVAKGAMLTHDNLIANMKQCLPFVERAGMQVRSETIVAPLPLYHIYAFMLHCLTMLSQGNHSLLIANPRDLHGFIRELGKHRYTAFVGLNTLFVGLMEHAAFRALDFSSLKLTLSGGMALTDAAARDWLALTGCAVVEGYGLTEASPVVALNPPGHQQVGSIGIALPSTEIRLLDSEGRAVATGEAGELCVRGPQVMRGYWQREQATAEVIVDGWLHTGDIAVVSDDGYLHIVDRLKDMVIVSGFNVYPNEVENVMSAHPDIVECAVIGVPDKHSGEAVKLFVVPRSPSLSEEIVRAYAREQLTAYKVPKFIEFRDSLPKSNVGKILRRELRAG